MAESQIHIKTLWWVDGHAQIGWDHYISEASAYNTSFQCMEATYPYAIKTQWKTINTPSRGPWVARHQQHHDRTNWGLLIRAQLRWSSTNKSGFTIHRLDFLTPYLGETRPLHSCRGRQEWQVDGRGLESLRRVDPFVPLFPLQLLVLQLKLRKKIIGDFQRYAAKHRYSFCILPCDGALQSLAVLRNNTKKNLPKY